MVFYCGYVLLYTWELSDLKLEQIRKKKKSRIRNRFIFRSIILAILLAAVVFSLVTNAKNDHTIYKVGDQAPDFQLTQINSNNELEAIQLSDFKGKGVMLNFWATFCKPCEAEMPYMEELYPKYKDKDVEIIAVSLDAAPLVIHKFINKYNLTFPIPHDSNDKVIDLYKTGHI